MKPRSKTIFHTVPDVADYLNQNDYQIARRTLHDHIKRGWLQRDEKGNFKKSAVDEYAKTYIAERKSRPRKSDTYDEKTQAEIKKIQAQAENWALRTRILNGEYIERVKYELDLAARLVVFRSDMMNFHRAKALDMVRMVDGDDKKIPDLVDFMTDNLELWLDRYANTDTEWSAQINIEAGDDAED